MTNSIQEEIARQSQDMGGSSFKCQTCKSHFDHYGCEKGVFVALEGANMSGCIYYERGRECPHCGRNH